MKGVSMPNPERLEIWFAQDHLHYRIYRAGLLGAIAGTRGDSLEEACRKCLYESRTPEGDAFEEAFLFAQEERERHPK